MNRFIILFAIVHWVAISASGEIWLTDYETALQKAKEENRYVLVDFTGSDWCGWCIRLNREVFSTEEFQDFAKEQLVCVKIDFPRKKKLSREVAERNDQLQRKFGVRGYPTVFVLGPDGIPLARTGYLKGGGQGYVNHLKSFIKNASMQTTQGTSRSD